MIGMSQHLSNAYLKRKHERYVLCNLERKSRLVARTFVSDKL
jgi:hypothetical protein